MAAILVNSDYEDYDVFIGNPSRWSNPFLVCQDGGPARVAYLYYRWLLVQPNLIDRAVEELKDKVLGCTCPPYPCHGDVLVQIVNDYWEGVEGGIGHSEQFYNRGIHHHQSPPGRITHRRRGSHEIR